MQKEWHSFLKRSLLNSSPSDPSGKAGCSGSRVSGGALCAGSGPWLGCDRGQQQRTSHPAERVPCSWTAEPSCSDSEEDACTLMRQADTVLTSGFPDGDENPASNSRRGHLLLKGWMLKQWKPKQQPGSFPGLHSPWMIPPRPVTPWHFSKSNTFNCGVDCAFMCCYVRGPTRPAQNRSSR